MKYRGLTFLKDFEQFGVFTGTIKEVWRHENLTFFALVVYKEDGDCEDIPVSEVERLLQRKDFHSGYNSKRAELGNGVLVLGRERAVGVKFACDVSCVRVVALEQEAIKVQQAEFSTQEMLVFKLTEIPSADIVKQHGIARDSISGGTFHCSRLMRKAVAGPPGLPEHGLQSADADILLVESEYEQKLTLCSHVCVELGSNTALEPVEVNTTERHENRCVDYFCKLNNDGIVLLTTIFIFAVHFRISVFIWGCLPYQRTWLFQGWDPPWFFKSGI